MASRIAVIGSGLAGLSAAARLAEAGHGVAVFDKGRGPGGRLATRRAADAVFDHGAPLFTPGDSGFNGFLERAVRDGTAATWQGGVVGVPDMKAPLRPLADAVELNQGVCISALCRDEGWDLLDTEGRRHGPFGRVICTTPAPQAAVLAADLPAIAGALGAVRMAPQWTVMLGWGEPVGADVKLSRPGGVIDTVQRMAAKPGRPARPEAWVVHASAGWTRANLDAGRAAIPGLLLPELAKALGLRLPAPGHADAHRWLYARTEVPLGRPFLSDPEGTLLFGGDWALGPDAGHAWASGTAMAEAVLTAEGTFR